MKLKMKDFGSIYGFLEDFWVSKAKYGGKFTTKKFVFFKTFPVVELGVVVSGYELRLGIVFGSTPETGG